MQTRTRRRPQQIFRPRACEFCKAKENPDYKDYGKLSPFLSDRGKIVGRNRSGICAKHQRKLAKAIKRARFLALLPFVQQA